jgi:hypothetical protein
MPNRLKIITMLLIVLAITPSLLTYLTGTTYAYLVLSLISPTPNQWPNIWLVLFANFMPHVLFIGFIIYCISFFRGNKTTWPLIFFPVFFLLLVIFVTAMTGADITALLIGAVDIFLGGFALVVLNSTETKEYVRQG